MSFSYVKNNNDDVPVALNQSRNRKPKIIYLEDTVSGQVFIDKDKITNDILFEVYGYEATNTITKRKKKKDELYERLKEQNSNHLTEYLTLEDKSQFFPIPWLETGRQCLYITGKSGSGKSYFTNKMLSVWKDLLRQKEIYVFAPKGNEENYKKFGKLQDIKDFVQMEGSLENSESEPESYEEAMQQYKQNKIIFKHKKKMLKENPEMLLELELALEKSKPGPKASYKKSQGKLDGLVLSKKAESKENAVFVFDDYENLSEGNQRRCLYFINNILENGRKHGNSIIMIKHQANSGRDTSRVISEMESFVIFSKNLPRNNRYLLEKYLELNKEQIRRIMDLLNKRNPHYSRWVYINPGSNYYVSEKKVGFI